MTSSALPKRIGYGDADPSDVSALVRGAEIAWPRPGRSTAHSIIPIPAVPGSLRKPTPLVAIVPTSISRPTNRTLLRPLLSHVAPHRLWSHCAYQMHQGLLRLKYAAGGKANMPPTRRPKYLPKCCLSPVSRCVAR
jgi:hypothetical protein